MSAQPSSHQASIRTVPRSIVHTATLVLVWLTFASSGLVFSEPCPTDALAMGLMVLLPLLGMVHFTPTLAVVSFAWFVIGAAALIANTASSFMDKAIIHTVVSLYLYGYAMIIAAFVAFKPDAHLKVIFSGWMFAGLLAAATGVLGYFGLIPGADLFTKFDRAAGTFKDPNVFGPFLVPPLLYALHLMLHGKSMRHIVLPMAACGLLALAIFLSFSRGAWLNLALATVVYLVLVFVTAHDNALRRKLITIALTGVAATALLVASALQFEPVAKLASERATAEKSYDVGPDGRFGGQEKARRLILSHPLGLGGQEFGLRYHHEEPHNVYLNMFLNAGWVGGTLYFILVIATAAAGFATALRRVPGHSILLIALAAFVANAAEGVIIDSDHWRHFYVLSAVMWGVATQPALRHARETLSFSGRRTVEDMA